MGELSGAHIHITGVVQGVGFRPFVYALATRLALTGWVRNTSAGVDIVVDGPAERLAAFTAALRGEAPPLARIDSMEVTARAPDGFTAFEIILSQPIAGAFQPISPDITICDDCRRELFDPADRRYRYSFINCTNCGPRFTIIGDIPYDRPQTTMAPFPMCPACAAEYQDPRDRRFHAQPVACPDCGPHIWLDVPDVEDDVTLMAADAAVRAEGPAQTRSERALQVTRELLQEGYVVAVKGLGGFHLACDATSAAAVTTLRRRKLRVDKPFAVMMPDVTTVSRHCYVSAAERALLASRARPIVILQRRPDSTIAEAVAPRQQTIGVMLPYTPLHLLLLEPADGFPEALVMTSGNISEEPIAYRNEEARERLATLADAFLLHNREIYVRCDDSVVRSIADIGGDQNEPARPSLYMLRRSRGYAPDALSLPWRSPPLLATGGELKNTFCLTRDQYAFLSQHIGDLENYETLRSFEEGIAHFQRLFRISPEAIAYDQHPNYLATRYARERAEATGLPALGVQHHHAHIAACMAEHGLAAEKKVIGLSFDGTGYGEDGAIWGGEFLVSSYQHYERAAHLAYVRLPGGDLAIREPWRIALAWLDAAGSGWDEDLPPVQYAAASKQRAQRAGAAETNRLDVLQHQLRSGLNAPLTSSMGRLFDAVAALAGVRQTVNYEAQAAIELEAQIDRHETGAYDFAYHHGIVDPAPVFAAIVADLHRGARSATIAARFHRGVAQMALLVCDDLRHQFALNEVALSGGVWQNRALLAQTKRLLTEDGFIVYVHQRVPTNDGGLALGQAAIAAHRMKP